MESRLGSAGRSMRKGVENGKSLDDYRHSKLLPHINEQLLLQKIINPRRDRTIVQSLSRTSAQLCIRKKKTQALQNTHMPIGRKPFSQFHQPTSQSIHQNRDKPRASLGLQKNISNKRFEKQSPCSTDPVCQVLQKDSKEMMEESSWGQTQTSSLRDNYIGRIVRNKTSRIIRNQRRQILNNIHDNIQGELSKSLFTDSVQNESSKIRHKQVKIKRIVRGYQKENEGEHIFDTFAAF